MSAPKYSKKEPSILRLLPKTNRYATDEISKNSQRHTFLIDRKLCTPRNLNEKH